MSGLLNDPFLLMLGVGIGIVLLCLFFAFADDSKKKQAKRVDRLRTRGQGTPAGEALQLRKGGGDRKKLDQMVRRFVPKPDMLRQRLYRTGRTISLGTFGIICGVVAVVAFAAMLILDFSFFIALPMGVLAGMWLPYLGVAWLGGRRGKRFMMLFPEAIGLMVRGRAGDRRPRRARIPPGHRPDPRRASARAGAARCRHARRRA